MGTKFKISKNVILLLSSCLLILSACSPKILPGDSTTPVQSISVQNSSSPAPAQTESTPEYAPISTYRMHNDTNAPEGMSVFVAEDESNFILAVNTPNRKFIQKMPKMVDSTLNMMIYPLFNKSGNKIAFLRGKQDPLNLPDGFSFAGNLMIFDIEKDEISDTGITTTSVIHSSDGLDFGSPSPINYIWSDNDQTLIVKYGSYKNSDGVSSNFIGSYDSDAGVLTKFAEAPPSTSIDIYPAAISKDRNLLLFHKWDGTKNSATVVGEFELYLYNIRIKEAKLISSIPYGIESRNFQNTAGRFIDPFIDNENTVIFKMNDEQHMAIYRYNPMTGQEAVLIDTGNPFAALICVSPDYERIYYKTHSADGDPDVVRVYDYVKGTVSDIPELNGLTDTAIQEKVLK